MSVGDALRPDHRRIATSPLETIGGDPARDYLADGNGEHVIIEPDRFRDLGIRFR